MSRKIYTEKIVLVAKEIWVHASACVYVFAQVTKKQQNGGKATLKNTSWGQFCKYLLPCKYSLHTSTSVAGNRGICAVERAQNLAPTCTVHHLSDVWLQIKRLSTCFLNCEIKYIEYYFGQVLCVSHLFSQQLDEK